MRAAGDVAWPVHRDARYVFPRTPEARQGERDPWVRHAGLRFLLLDPEGNLVGFSRRPATLCELLDARRAARGDR